MLAARPRRGRGPAAPVEHAEDLTAQNLWAEVSRRLQESLNDSTYRTWFGEVDGDELSDATFALAVPNDFTRDWIEGHFVHLIAASAREATGADLSISLVVRDHRVGAG